MPQDRQDHETTYAQLYASSAYILDKVVNERKSLRELIEAHRIAGTRLSSRSRAFVRFAVYGALRSYFTNEWKLSLLLKSPKKLSTKVKALLHVALAMLRNSTTPPPLVVDSSIHALSMLDAGWAHGVVNSVLRQISEKEFAIPSKDDDPVTFLKIGVNLPEWLAERCIAKYGFDETIELGNYFMTVPPVSIRPNTLKTNRDKLCEILKSEGVSAEPGKFIPAALRIPADADFGKLKSFNKGLYSVQNEASQAVSIILNPQPADSILDMCAAPGTKTTHIHELAQGKAEIIATDIDNDRLLMLQKDLKRLDITSGITLLPQDALYSTGRKEYSAVLLDAPCTGIGTWSRHPDGRIHRAPEDVVRLADTQRELLERSVKLVKRGGKLLYSVCTLTDEETTLQIRSFLERHKEFSLIHPEVPETLKPLLNDAGEFVTVPHRHHVDGFYSALMIKN